MGMSSSSHTSLLLLLVLLLLVPQFNIVNSFQQENDDLTNQTKNRHFQFLSVGDYCEDDKENAYQVLDSASQHHPHPPPYHRHCHNFQGESHRPLQRSKRRWVITTFELEEEDPGPFPKLVGEMFNDMSEKMSLMYFISGPGVDEYPEVGLLSLEEHETGKIYVHRPVDRETTPSFTVYFDVVNRLTGKTVDKSLVFNIRISDVNDHAPQFPEEEFDISVREDHAAGQPIFQMVTVDLDQENTPNSQVLYFLVSQTPTLKQSGFQIDRISGEIRLSGCLDYETAPRFTLLIRARDCGEPPLSSTATVHVNVQEGNNHVPTFAQENYEIHISEGQVSQGVLRLPVQDGDTPLTSAWRAKFNIMNGNEEGHFDILTDRETNEGILNVIEPLDYETHPVQSLVIAVENEEPLFLCEEGELQKPRRPVASATVRVLVTDADDPPAFHPRSLIISEVEGASPGIQLGMFNTTDPDRTASQIRYKVVHDPANWVTVDEQTGAVITREQIDRESPYVNDSFYIIIVHAVDDGLRPQTGTGTLMLFLSDINDNAPTLHPRSRYVEVCESAVNEPLVIEAEDGDLEPYSDPFTFELDDTGGNAEDTWKLGENRGRSAELLMLRSLPRGNYSVPLFIGDKQGLSQKQTVHVRVCSCPGGFTCAEHSVAGAGLFVEALAPLCAGFLALAVTLLFLLRCYFVSEAKRHRCSIPHEFSHQTLITYNDKSKAISTQGRSDVGDQMTVLLINTAEVGTKLRAKDMNDMLPPPASASDQTHFVLGTPGYGYGVLFEPRGVSNKYSTPVVYPGPVVPRQPLEVKAGTMVETLSQKLCGIDMLEDDTGDLPHVYTEEGEYERAETLSSLDFSEQELPPDLLDCLGSKAAPPQEFYSESGVPS